MSKCKWKWVPSDYDFFETECGVDYSSVDAYEGNLKEMNFNYCPNCGKEIEEQLDN